jgi:uncharacterized delta-60 repeat protein
MFPINVQAFIRSGIAILLSIMGAHRSSYGQGLTYDPTFQQGTGVNNSPFEVNIFTVRVDNADNIYACGYFKSYDGVLRSGFLRLLPDGSLDTQFCSGSGAFPSVALMDFQSDGRVILGGQMETFDGQPCFTLSRLNLDGTLDATFNSGITWDVTALTVLPNDEILACGRGNFGDYYVRRFSADGVMDPSFSPIIDNTAWTMEAQADGKILLGGVFDTVNGTALQDLVRLHPDGSVDTTFDPPVITTENQIRAIAVQPDGKILVGVPYSNGGFGPSRLLENGSLDPTFQSSLGAIGGINDLNVLPNGQVVVSGLVVDENFVQTSSVVIINGNGSVAQSTICGPFGFGYSTAVDSQGRIVVGGTFQNCDSEAANGLCRLIPCTETTYYADADGDGFGNAAAPWSTCAQPSGHVLDATDGDDTTPSITGPATWYLDGDGDGFGMFDQNLVTCSQPMGYSATAGDCDDMDVFIYPEAPCDDDNPFTHFDRIRPDCTCAGQGVQVSPVVYLDVPLNDDGLMDATLLANGLLPTTEPYTTMGYQNFANGVGGFTTTPQMLDPDPLQPELQAVDWVIVELRSVSSPNTILAASPGLLRRNGSITKANELSPSEFALELDEYFISVRHRNHLGVITLQPVSFDQPVPVVLNFSDGSTPVNGGSNALKSNGTKLALWPGDVRFNRNVQYAGQNNDRDPILVRIGGVVPTNTAQGYYPEDVNLDGVVKYTGTNNDRDKVLQTIGGVVPTNIRLDHLPN